MEKISWTNNIREKKKFGLGEKEEKETLKEKKDGLTRTICAILMTSLWTSFLEHYSIQGKKLGEKEIAEVTKEKETQKEKKTDKLELFVQL